MITKEDKIKTFANYVYKKDLSNSYQLIKDTERKHLELLNNKQKEIEEKSVQLKNKMAKKIKNETQKIISEASLTSKENILNLKRKLLENLTQEIINSLINFTETEAYKEYFYMLLDNCKDYLTTNQDIKVYLLSKDRKKFQREIMNRCKGAEIFDMDDDYIGGFIIEPFSGRERLDFSLKGRVLSFSNEIGIALYEALEM